MPLPAWKPKYPFTDLQNYGKINVLKFQTLDAYQKCQDKQCRPRSTEEAVWSGSSLFAILPVL